MRVRALALTAAAALSCSIAAYAQQGDSPVPVTINSCAPDVESSSASQPNIAGVPLTSQSNGIAIEFVNDSQKTADLINFDVNSNGSQFVIRDVGTFSPGVSIKHKYRNGEGQAFLLPSLIAPKISCSVASVRFSDGTTWIKGRGTVAQNSPGAAPASQNISVTPAQVQLDATTESNLFLVSSVEPLTAFREIDNCSGVAEVSVAATGQSTAAYSVKPLGPGSCTATIRDAAGNALSVPIVVR